jgi:hypothetical protein
MSPSGSAGRRRWVVAGAFVVAGALVAAAAVSATSDQPGVTAGGAPSKDAATVDSSAVMHVEVACDLADKAERAATAPELEERARYAVAVLLLDQAIIESARAVEFDAGLVALDSALQTAHAAGHASDDDGWQSALRVARDECATVLG